jgi:GT2 family glycosyltransferase
MEIVVVDDVSTDGTAEAIKASFPDVLLIRNMTTSFVSHTRNMGMANASGDLLFLVDDDNVLDPQCISMLVEAFLTHPAAGLIGPIMYYLRDPNRIWCAGIDRSMVTSVTKIVGRDEMDTGQYSTIMPSKDFPNAFMISKKALEKAGGFNEDLFPFHYEESDIAERIRRAGFDILLQPKAKDWHDIPTPETTEDRLRLLHIHDPKRAYFAGRNRTIFFRLYSKPYERALYLLIFNWAMALYYLVEIARNKMRGKDDRLGLAKGYVAGIFDGLRQDLASGRS